MALFAPHAVKLAVTAKTPAIVISFLPNGKTPRGFIAVLSVFRSCLGCAAGGGFKLVSYVHSSVGHKKRNDIHRPETLIFFFLRPSEYLIWTRLIRRGTRICSAVRHKISGVCTHIRIRLHRHICVMVMRTVVMVVVMM